MSTLHALLPIKEGETAYVARKYVFETPISNARRMALPAFAFLFGGKLPALIVSFHDMLVENFGIEDGSIYFDKACIIVPCIIILVLAQFVVTYVKNQLMDSDEKGNDHKKEKKNSKNSKTQSSQKNKKGKND